MGQVYMLYIMVFNQVEILFLLALTQAASSSREGVKGVCPQVLC